MPQRIDEIMNPELFSLRPSDACADAAKYLRALGVHAAPVVDDNSIPVGMFSLWDAGVATPADPVSQHMTPVVESTRVDTSIADAAAAIGRSGHHHLVVVDANGQAVGFVSAVDVIRALVGLPTQHPDTFPHFDEASGLVWTDDCELTEDGISAAPDGPGVYVLVRSASDAPDTIVWVESSANVRQALRDLLEGSDSQFSAAGAQGTIRFRAAAAEDPALRRRAHASLGDRVVAGRRPPPG